MTEESVRTTGNPFADPATDSIAPVVTERDLLTEATLALGKNGSLTLAQDAVILLDDYHQEQPRRFCGINLPTRTKVTQTIPYFNILSASLTKSDFTLRYAKPVSKSKNSILRVQTLIYPLNSPHELALKWTARLLDRAYGPSQRNKRIKVLINPFGGMGRAPRDYFKHCAPIFDAAECVVDYETTKHQGHAVEIARELDITAYDVIACASGDGLPMEAFNGLAEKPNAAEALRRIAVVQLPCGTGNALSWNFNGTASLSLAALTIVKGVRTPLDLASVTQPSGKRTLSFLSQSIGIIAESDLGTDNIRWMGDLRFTFGFLVRLLGKTVWPVDMSVKTEIDEISDIKRHYAQEVAKRKADDGHLRSHEILDQELESSTALGLPPLTYGTVEDPLPTDSGWTPLEPYINLGNFYCGNMCYMAADAPFFPASLPNDGMLDLVTIDGDIGRLKAIALLLDAGKGTLMDSSIVRYRKVTAVRVIPRFGWKDAQEYARAHPSAGHGETSPPRASFLFRLLSRLAGVGDKGVEKEGFFSVDGEKLPFGPFQIEIHRGLGTSLSKRYRTYEYDDGPSGWRDFEVKATEESDS